MSKLATVKSCTTILGSITCPCPLSRAFSCRCVLRNDTLSSVMYMYANPISGTAVTSGQV